MTKVHANNALQEPFLVQQVLPNVSRVRVDMVPTLVSQTVQFVQLELSHLLGAHANPALQEPSV